MKREEKLKKKKLFDAIGIGCGVLVVLVALLSGIILREPPLPAGTVLAVDAAEHQGKAIAKQVETMSGVTPGSRVR